MKTLQRTFRRHYNTLDRHLKRTVERVSPAEKLLLVEVTGICFALLFLLTGSRVETLDLLGARADIVAILAAAGLLGVLHFFVNRHLLTRLDRRFPLRAYDERRILFDLGQAARGATNINQIYEHAVREIAAALRTTKVSIFVRDDVSGDYLCRVSSTEPMRAHRPTRERVEDFSFNTNVLAADALIVKRLRGLGAPLGLTPNDLETWMRAVASMDPMRRAARERECAALRNHDARLLLGITMQERLVGILSLGQRNGSRGYTAEDKRLLLSVASQLAFVIENAKLVERMVAEEGLRRELSLASEVQQRLLPANAPQSEAFTLSAFCQPALAVGGDYYDFIKLSDGQTAIAVADVAGKGISAALLMSSVQASLRSQTMTHCANTDNTALPAELVGTMNRLVYASTGAASYVTFFYAQFDEAARTLSYVNAGHNPPLLLRTRNDSELRLSGRPQRDLRTPEPAGPPRRGFGASAVRCPSGACTGVAEWEKDEISYAGGDDFPASRVEVRELTEGGPVLGIFEDCLYEQETVSLESGDLLLAYTDGLTESLNAEGLEFGEERLRKTLAALAHLSADEVRRHVVEEVQAWCRGTQQHDDLTFVVLKVK